MDDEFENNEEERGGDMVCPRCGLRLFDPVCPNCGTPIVDKADDEDEEYDWREKHGGKRR